jgi:mannan endo-1,4-beta-mannosidase
MARSGLVGTEGTRFNLDGNWFPVAGANCYYLGYSPEDAPEVLESALDLAAAFSVNVLRIWGFLDLAGGGTEPPRDGQWGACFQYFHRDRGVVQVTGEDGLDRLDRAVLACAARGIKVIVVLSNSLADYGGMDQYLRWLSPDGSELFHDEFFEREDAARAFEEWVSFLFNKEVGATGRAYKDEPAIMAWELANEPRCSGHRNLPARADCARSGRIVRWVERMSAFLKSIDPDHLVAVGDEGFFNHWRSRSPLYNGAYGIDCEALLRIPTIDFGTYHLYPQAWEQTDPEFGSKWIRQHRKAAREIGKPVLLEEFGLRVGDGFVPDAATRDETYARWLRAALGEGGGGALVWMLAGVDRDGSRYRGDPFCLYSADETPRFFEEMRRGTAGAT